LLDHRSLTVSRLFRKGQIYQECPDEGVEEVEVEEDFHHGEAEVVSGDEVEDSRLTETSNFPSMGKRGRK
jgi:hypothetical protein